MSRTFKDHKDYWETRPEYWTHHNIPSWHKNMTKRERRKKEKQAVRTGKEPPIFKKDDCYYW